MGSNTFASVLILENVIEGMGQKDTYFGKRN